MFEYNNKDANKGVLGTEDVSGSREDVVGVRVPREGVVGVRGPREGIVCVIRYLSAPAFITNPQSPSPHTISYSVIMGSMATTRSQTARTTTRASAQGKPPLARRLPLPV